MTAPKHRTKIKLSQTDAEIMSESIKQDNVKWRAEKRIEILKLIKLANSCISLHNNIIDISPNRGRLSQPLALFAQNIVNTLEDISVEDYSQKKGYGWGYAFPWECEFEPVLKANEQFLNYILYREQQIIRDNEEREKLNALQATNNE